MSRAISSAIEIPPLPKGTPKYPSVPKLWPGETVVCIASGPSLTREDCDFVRGKARVIVVNTSYRMAPWADCLYACDARWWQWARGAPDFHGMKYALQRRAERWPGVVALRIGTHDGLSTDPTTLNTGKNSGYQAINLAVHLGAKRIILLGYDMQKGKNGEHHWHKEHPSRTPDIYRKFLHYFNTIEEPLKQLSIEVINCSRVSALKIFPRMSLEEAFAIQQEDAA